MGLYFFFEEIILDAKVARIVDATDRDRDECEHAVLINIRAGLVHASVGEVDQPDQVEFVDEPVRQRNARDGGLVAGDVTADEDEIIQARGARVREAGDFKIGIELEGVEAVALSLDLRGEHTRLSHGADEHHERHQ